MSGPIIFGASSSFGPNPESILFNSGGLYQFKDYAADDPQYEGSSFSFTLQDTTPDGTGSINITGIWVKQGLNEYDDFSTKKASIQVYNGSSWITGWTGSFNVSADAVTARSLSRPKTSRRITFTLSIWK